MQAFDTALPEVKIVKPERFADPRGWFSEVWNRRALTAVGIVAAFAQQNHVRSPQVGTLRGLHYQIPPTAQGKLVRVVRGAIFDVAVDLRRDSPTFGQHATAVLSSDNWLQLWIPAGFAHGYCTIENDTEVEYSVTDYYSPQHERGIVWNDPALTIDWPMEAERLIISERDRKLPRLTQQSELFEYAR